MDPIYARRSCRSFTDEPVTEKDVRAVLQAAMAAPTAVNARPWEFYVTRDASLMERLASVSPYAGPASKAPVLVVPCYRDDCRAPEYAQIDMAIACQNLMLEAAARGLGTVLLGIAPESERMAAVKEVLALPEHVECFGLVPLGHPAHEAAPHGDDVWDEERVHRL